MAYTYITTHAPWYIIKSSSESDIAKGLKEQGFPGANVIAIVYDSTNGEFVAFCHK